MSTSAQLALVKNIQRAFSILAILNINGHWFPEDTKVFNGDTYDFIVVGSGGAGVVVAARLVEANFNVLLIEAGCNSDLESNFPGLVTYIKQSRMDWIFTTETDERLIRCHNPKGLLFGKAVGGSGTTNYMTYSRGNPGNYERIYETTKNPLWKWESLRKYFLKSEDLKDRSILNSEYKKYHSTEGAIAITKENRPVCNDYLNAFKQAGESVVVDIIGSGALGFSTGLYYVFDGNRSEAATSYLPRLKHNTRLHITRNSLVTKLIINDKKTVVGVEFIKDGRTYCVYASKEVIVSAGPVKSPQLLMLSGIGPEEELQKFKINIISNIPVGKKLQNDIGALLVFKTNRKADPGQFNAHDYPAPLIVGHGVLNKSSSDSDYETLNYIIDDAGYFLRTCGFYNGYKPQICDKLNELSAGTQKFQTVLFSRKFKSRGEVKLSCTDPFQQPRIINNYFSEHQDLEDLAKYIMDFMKIIMKPSFKKIGVEFLDGTKKCGHLEFGTMEYWRCYIMCMIVTTGRHVGTCSMGTVVNNDCKVIGVENLRVVDASVIPASIGGAVYPLVVALGEKASVLIKESHSKS